MTRFAVNVTVIISTENDDENPVSILDEILCGHDKLAGNFSIESNPSIVPEGEWTEADQYNAIKCGWCVITDTDGQQFIGAVQPAVDERTDAIAQKYVIRRALVDDDQTAIRAIKYLKHHFPSIHQSMVYRAVNQGN